MAFTFQSKSQSLFRPFSTTTTIFASSPPSSSRPITFGQLLSPDLTSTSTRSIMDSPFSTTPSCPCCSFLGGDGLFLPWNEDGEQNDDSAIDGVKNRLGDLSLLSATDSIITPHEAWKRISAKRTEEENANDTQQRGPIVLVDTHGHPHLEREVQYADKSDAKTSSSELKDSSKLGVVSLTCGVSPTDWQDALDYASKSSQFLPALGVHPWYLGDIMVDYIDKIENCEDIKTYLKWDWLTDLEKHLSEHPHLLVGEIGLCKMARFVREFPKEKGGKATALQLQKVVFRTQLELAAMWSRPVTVHCVNAHGLFMEVMKDMLKKAKESCVEKEDEKEAKKHWRKAFPPAIACHSFTGTAHHVSEILEFEKELLYPEEIESGGKRRRRKQKDQPLESQVSESGAYKSNDGQREILFYFGFSHAVNHLMCTSEKARKKGMEAVQSIPPDRLLVESDVHASVDVALGTAGAVAYAAQVRGESLEEVAERTTRNGLRFLSSLGSVWSVRYQVLNNDT